MSYYIEAKRILHSIDKTELKTFQLENYYSACFFFYYHYSHTCYDDYYKKVSDCYTDSMVIAGASYRSETMDEAANRYIALGDYKAAEEIYLQMLEDEGSYTYDYAATANAMGIILMEQGKIEEAKKYYTLSAIADIINSKKENAAFNYLASIYKNEGDLSKAFKYTQSAIDDANFCRHQFRTAQLAKLYSMTNVMYQSAQSKSKAKLMTYNFVVSILSIILTCFIIYTYIQMRKMSIIKREVSTINLQLVNLNKMLNESNNKLIEANRVKEQYIAQFFELCSSYIDKMENNRKIRYKLIINKKIDELTNILKSNEYIKEEAVELYRNFDAIFLGLYPTFVTEFNALLSSDDKIVLKADDLLNRELRIYALLRLGITDNFKIASFLRCSMSTVYNYRTRARNRAMLTRDSFEDAIMKIGTL